MKQQEVHIVSYLGQTLSSQTAEGNILSSHFENKTPMPQPLSIFPTKPEREPLHVQRGDHARGVQSIPIRERKHVHKHHFWVSPHIEQQNKVTSQIWNSSMQKQFRAMPAPECPLHAQTAEVRVKQLRAKPGVNGKVTGHRQMWLQDTWGQTGTPRNTQS